MIAALPAPPESPRRSTATGDLGVGSLTVTSNLQRFAGQDYLAPASRVSGPLAVHCHDVAHEPVDVRLLDTIADRSYRGRRFREGYYLAQYFGAPAHLVSRGDQWHVFGTRLERTVWPYFVKMALTRLAIRGGYLHLKAAAVVVDGRAVLLVGGNASGKSTLLRALHDAGGAFLSNTHAMVREGLVHGVPSSIRLRDDGPGVERLPHLPHMEAGCVLVRPRALFDRHVAVAPLAAVVVCDHRGPAGPELQDVPAPRAKALLGQLALGTTVYGLREDVLDELGHDLDAASAWWAYEQDALSALVEPVPTFHVSVDARNPAAVDRLWSTLAAVDTPMAAPAP